MEFIKKYKNDNGILDFGVYGQTSKIIDEFYDVSPFPNYNNYKDLSDFLEISEKNTFLSELKQYIGYNKKIIEGLHHFSALPASWSQPKQPVDCILRILRFSPLLCAPGRDRTGTDITVHRILSPACLPIPPPGHTLISNNVFVVFWCP